MPAVTLVAVALAGGLIAMSERDPPSAGARAGAAQTASGA